MIKDSVTVAYVHSDQVSESFHQCIVSLIGYDLANFGRVATGGWLSARCYGGDALPVARNDIVKQFLNGDAEWLMWLDSDMGFAPDTVDRLLEVADPVERPIVGGLCFAFKATGPDGLGGHHSVPLPTIFEWTEWNGHTGFVSVPTYPVGSVVKTAGTGSACILIHRTVFDRINEKFGGCWYDRIPNPSNAGQLIGEDLSFCMRAGAVKPFIPVHVDTRVKTTHHKPIWVGEDVFWAQHVAPPATEKVSVLVPVLNRPQNAEPFMRSLIASTGLARVYAIVDASDTQSIAEWRRQGASVLRFKSDHPGTFAEKVNYAANHDGLTTDWLFITGDDVEFRPGWLDHAQSVAGDKFHVIGTNDLGNPRVTSGEHATHLLIRRSYMDSVGCGWPGSGKIAHEGYGHNFVDDEIVTVAKQRDVWAMALSSRVEHNHPAWGKSEMDDTYALGRSSYVQDQELYLKRLSEHG